MSLIINGKTKNIIDRTVPEMVKSNRQITRKEILHFCYLLKEIGIDYIELDKDSYKRIGRLPVGFKFIYRVKDEEDIKIFIKNNFDFIVIGINEFIYSKLEHIKELGKKKIIFEVKLEGIDTIINKNCISNIEVQKLSMINKIIEANKENCLRLQGVYKDILSNWEEVVSAIKANLNLKVDVCPEDKAFMATSVALEALESNIDSVTLSFTGKGEPFRFAALEEVILALKIIKGYNIQGKTWPFAELYNFYKKITKENVSTIKAVIGEDIFKYESGIHADGIGKNPATYEPYDPKLVGQSRKMIIGKHSGSKSVINKLIELDLDYRKIDINSFLEQVRVKSIQNRGEIIDEELLCMLNL